MSNKNKKLTLIIGYGYWGKKVFRVLKSLNENIYIYDPFIKKSHNSESNFINNIKEIDPDNIVITTPVKYHYFYISKFINKRKKIFVEKPILMPNENMNLKKIINENIFTGYVYLYNKFIINLKKIISKKK